MSSSRIRYAFTVSALLVVAGQQAAIAAAPAKAATPTKATAPAARPAAATGVSGLGRPATAEQVRAWDIDVLPDGTGLPRGAGSVQKGEQLYEDKCASCHGSFGENTEWIAIAGGVKKGDIERGRAATLTDAAPIRTVGTKLNAAPSLWDYIYRAMPLTAPKSLSPDETYSITAYVLHLNEILPADAEVNEKTLAQVKMPNRLGFTEEHGFKTRLGKPDVKNTACMKDCEKEVKITSELPEHARDSHGQLREQMRWYGAVRGVDTTLPAGKSAEAWRSGAILAAMAAGTTKQAGAVAHAGAGSAADLVKSQGCVACHGFDSRIVGPGFNEIAAKYKGEAAVEGKLIDKLKQGGAGTWGQVPMPPQPQLGPAEARSIVQWILSGAKP